MTENDAIEWIDLQDIRDDESWVTDPDKVEAFARHIKQGKMFSSLLLRRVWHEDGAFHYEIIDGFHRYRALLYASVERHPATVVECDDRTADYDRAQASLDKPSNVLHKRAVHAIQQGFVRDMLDTINASQMLERVFSETGEVSIQTRTAPVTSDPIDALLAVIEHEYATKLKSKRDKYAAMRASKFALRKPPEIGKERETWEDALDKWLDEMCAWFGVRRDWLIGDALGLSALDLDSQDDKGGHQRWIWRAILRVPDTDVRKQLLTRTRHERPSKAIFELAFKRLGMSMGFGTSNSTYPVATVSKSDMLRLLAGNTLAQLATMQEIVDRKPVPPSVPTDTPVVEIPVNKEAIFATGSPRFTNADLEPLNRWTVTKKTAISEMGIAPDMLIKSISTMLFYARSYEQDGGDMGNPKLQKALDALYDWLIVRRNK